MATKRLPVLDGNDQVPASLLPIGTSAGTVAAGDDPRLSSLVNAKAYGGVQAAIGALPSAGGTVYVPSGAYTLTDELVARGNLTLLGDGDDATVITQTVANKNAITGTALSRLTIQGMRIVGTGGGTGTGLALAKGVNPATTYVSLRDVTFDSFGQDGVAVENLIVSCFERVIAVSNGRYGINLYGQNGGAAGTSVSLNGCYGNANGAAGIRLYNMVYSALNACAADHNPAGYLIDSCQSVVLSGCGAEGNATNGFKVNGGVGVTATGCWVYDNRGVGVYVTGNASAVSLIGAVDNSPNASATQFMKVDAGCNVAVMKCVNTSPNSFAAGTTNVIADGSGGMQVNGYAALLSGGEIDSDLTCYVAGKGFVLTDRVNGSRYRLRVSSGALSVELVP